MIRADADESRSFHTALTIPARAELSTVTTQGSSQTHTTPEVLGAAAPAACRDKTAGMQTSSFCPWNGLGNVKCESVMASVLLDGTASLSAAPTRETKDLRDTALFFQVQYSVKLKEPCFVLSPPPHFLPMQITSCNGPWKFEVKACHSISE